MSNATEVIGHVSDDHAESLLGMALAAGDHGLKCPEGRYCRHGQGNRCHDGEERSYIVTLLSNSSQQSYNLTLLPVLLFLSTPLTPRRCH